MIIESVNNEHVKYLFKLKEKKYRDSYNEFLIEGDHLLKEALKTNLVKEIIALDETYKVEGILFSQVTDKIMKKLSSQVTFPKVIAVGRKMESSEIKGNAIILDNIQDPGNLGAIIRSAVAFNINTIIMSKDTVDLYNEKVIRASEGMIFKLNYVKDDLIKVIKDLKTKNYKIYGTDVLNGVELKSVNSNSCWALIIGNEGKGMSDNLKEFCDLLINIKINDKCESLNASIAASIIIYELNRG